MNDIEERNARIESTMLGTEGHGIMTAMLTLNYGGAGQGFGGYRLDSPRGPSAAMGLFVARVLEVVGVETWEALKDKSVRVRADYSHIHALGHYLDDKWFVPKVELARLVEASR